MGVYIFCVIIIYLIFKFILVNISKIFCNLLFTYSFSHDCILFELNERKIWFLMVVPPHTCLNNAKK